MNKSAFFNYNKNGDIMKVAYIKALGDSTSFKKNIYNGVKIKASGGIKTKEDLEAFINAGASRIGCSGAIKALNLDK